VNVKELAPGVGPTGRQHNVATLGQPLESGITVNLQNAAECFEVRGGPLRLAIGTVEVDGCRWIGPTPRPIVARRAGIGYACPPDQRGQILPERRSPMCAVN
jgi:hypothetical protein